MELYEIAIGIFVFFVALVWLLLPFAVFGIKEKLSEIIKELKKLNEFFEKKVK